MQDSSRATRPPSPTATPTADARIAQELGPFPGAERALGVCVDGSRIWYATGDAVVALERRSGRLTSKLTVSADAGTAFDGRYLYQLANDTIQKIDPETGEVVGTLAAPAGGRDSGMAWAEGSLWVGEYRAGKIHRIDPVSGTLLATIRSDRFVTGVAWHQGELWHGSQQEERSELRRVDPAGTVHERLRMPKGVTVAGLDLTADGSFVCGGGSDGKLRIVERPE